MNHNKNYFLLYVSTVLVNDGTGLIRANFSLRYILGQLYDKYNAFSIKLEGFICRTAATAVISDDFVLLHMEGLPFMNGFDTSLNYRNSRVIEMIDYAGGNLGYNFMSNCNGVNFWKPSTEKIDLKLFHTRLTDETRLVNNDDVVFIFSITGLDKYKVIHPIKDIIIPRFPAMKTVNLSLSTYKATSTDSRNRAFRFSGINLRSIIGSDYDKYKKFALITKSYSMSEYSGTAYYQAFSGFLMSNIMISGFDWFRPSLSQYYSAGTLAQQTEINNIHPTPSCVVCQVVYGSGGSAPRAYKETYIENVFEKSQDTIDITISNTQIYSYSLVPFNAGNAQLFPHYTFNFDIIPLKD